MNPIGFAAAIPTELFGALRALPRLARDIAKIAETTSALPAVERATVAMEEHTRAIAQLREDMSEVAEATKVLPPMDERMANIEAAMPVLVEVQQHLTVMPQTLARLDASVAGMATLLEQLLVTMEELTDTLTSLEGSVGPLGRLAGRLPGGRRAARAAARAEAEAAAEDGSA